jgi:hypothetical protein
METFKLILSILITALFFSDNSFLYELVYFLIFVSLTVHILFTKTSLKNKILMPIVYGALYFIQSVIKTYMIFPEDVGLFQSIIGRVIGIIFLVIPFVLDKLVSMSNPGYFPSVKDIGTFTFNELKENAGKIKDMISRSGKSLSRDNLNEIITDLPRHNSFRYINKDSLTNDYFSAAYETLVDEKLYLVLSNTKSAASELISLVTNTSFNHASLSFDSELKTIVSYNGGERVYPPGLNFETIKNLQRRKDSSILVYSVLIGKEKKKMIIDRIKEINEEGSAYNLLGLFLKRSFKPNIMYCSQFVYKMLEYVGIKYLNKNEYNITPSDLVELDYERKLDYEYRIGIS